MFIKKSPTVFEAIISSLVQCKKVETTPYIPYSKDLILACPNVC